MNIESLDELSIIQSNDHKPRKIMKVDYDSTSSLEELESEGNDSCDYDVDVGAVID